MIVKEYIKDFENLGFGMFVHFGLYSILGRGEWAKYTHNIPAAEYESLKHSFCPHKDWAKDLASTAKKAGCRYITLTSRHHDGFSLYDTCGLNDYDSVHGCGRDLIKEFVEACRENGIIPFFYHTLLDWHEPTYNADFPAYLSYLRKSVELLCTNYGKIGGIWFDGMWNKKEADWEEDALYSMIRKYQPDAMIINNTGLGAMGELGHIELDSVTFERGKPKPINLEGSPKYIASEMCQIFAEHWGYAKKDLHYKSLASIIEDLAVCRRYRSNFLLNVGPKGDGTLRPMDKAMLEAMGEWVEYNEDAIRTCEPTGIAIDGKDKDFILKKDENTYYLFVHDLPMSADPNVAVKRRGEFTERFTFDKRIKSVEWTDGGILEFSQNDITTEVYTTPFLYGEDLVVRVARIVTE
ncbi:MAG: alpha-L-fucosidase [Ruminococcaceae bacterium]|nr:alpha-L-fucosidase [Oscillospiraceae bacterium]